MEIGDKVRWNKEAVKFIESQPIEDRDVIYYTRNLIFDIEDVKKNTIKLSKTGFGWCDSNLFNVL